MMKLFCALLISLSAAAGMAQAPAAQPGQETPKGDRIQDAPSAQTPAEQPEKSEDGSANGNKVDPRELLEQVMMARLSKDLALDEQQTVLLVRRFMESRDRFRELRAERGKKLRELKETARTAQDEAALNQQLEALRALDKQMITMREELFEEASSGFTSWQRARLYIFMTEFESDLRRMVQRARERHGGGEEGKGRWERHKENKDEDSDNTAPPSAPEPSGVQK